MQRVRRDSASSTDSWSIIEKRHSPEMTEAVLDSDECGSDSEIEIGEEAFDSNDSDIEVDDQSRIDEEEEQREDEDDEEEKDESDSEVEEEMEETEEAPEWGLVSQKEAMSGEGKHFVTPEKIKTRLDNVIERRDNSQKIALFLKVSFACFVIQNLALFYSLLLSRPIYHAPEVKNIRMQPFSPLKPYIYNNSASLQCWSPRMAAIEVMEKKVSLPSRLSWENITLIWEKRSWFKQPSVPQTPKPSTYGKTTISRQRVPQQVCLRKDSPPTMPKTLYPCSQQSPMPTPPKRKEPMSPFSALKSIIRSQTVEAPKVKATPKPRTRNFNYKLEFTPAPKKAVLQPPPRDISIPKIQKKTSKQFTSVNTSNLIKKDLITIPEYTPTPIVKRKVVHSLIAPDNKPDFSMKTLPKQKSKKSLLVPKVTSEWDKEYKKCGTFVPKRFMEKKRFSSKASQLMRNSSYTNSHKQCKREEFKQFNKRMLEDKSRRRRQRLLEYKVEKPCRAIYEEKKRMEKAVKKVDKLQAKIQKKLQKIENKIQKRRQLPLTA